MAARGPSADRLEDRLSEPLPPDVECMGGLHGDILVLGVGGKMGPTLARLALRASRAAGSPRRVIGVSRFTRAGLRQRLEGWGVETIAADLLSPRCLRNLPTTPNVVFMVGFKFGTGRDPSRTWAVNAYVPSLAAERFAGSRIVAFSSGNIYPLSAAPGPGCSETAPTGPLGEYAQSVLARERLLEHFSRRHGTPMALMRLNYAVEPRYGVLRDIAETVVGGRPVELSMGHVNVIWQRDANSVALRLLRHCSSPPFVLNVTGVEPLSVRWLAERLGRELGVEPRFSGREEATALLSDASLCASLFGAPSTDVERMIRMVADWVRRGGSGLAKPTHFEQRDGAF